MANQVEIRVVATGAEQAARVLLGVADAGAAVGRVVTSGSREASQGLLSLGDSAKRVFEIFTGVSLGNIFVDGLARLKEFTVETAKLGLEAKVQEDAFARFTQSVGVYGDALVANMQKASGGLLNVSDVMISAVRLLQEGLQPEQIVRTLEIARQQAKIAGKDVADTFNSMATAIANQSEKGLKAVQINIDLQSALQRQAEALGTDVAHLQDAAKAQAFYNEMVDKTRTTVESLSGAGRTQSEMVQTWAAQWKQFREDLGKLVVDEGFALIEWLDKTRAQFPPIAAQLKAWAGLWLDAGRAAVAALEPVVRILGDTVIPLLKASVAFSSTFALGLTTAFTVVAGPLAYLASILDDLANKRWPSHTRATLEANVATAESRVRLAEAVEKWNAMKDGIEKTDTATQSVTKSLDMGRNKIADTAQAVRPAVAEFDALAKAMRALADQAVIAGLSEDEAKMLSLTRGVREAIAATKNLGVEAIAAFTAYADSAARAIIQAEELKTITKDLADAEREFWTAASEQNTAPLDAMAKWVDAMQAAKVESTTLARSTGDTLKAQIQATESAIVAMTKALGEDNVEVTILRDKLKELKADAFENTLANIGTQAKLLGPDFDALGATVEAVKREMLDAADAAHGELTPAVVELKGRFDELVNFQKTQKLFEDLFASVGEAVNTLVQGVLLGTQTMAEAFKKLGEAIVVQFVNKVIQEALDPLVKYAAQAVTALLYGGTALAGIGAGATPAAGAGSGGGGVAEEAAALGIGGSYGPITNALSLGQTGYGLASMFPGVMALGSNFAAGGISGALFGLPVGAYGAGVGLEPVSAATPGLFGAGGAVGALTLSMSALAAAFSTFQGIMAAINGNAAQAAAQLGGVAAGAIIGTFINPGAGTVIGAALGGVFGGFLGGLFGGEPELTHEQREQRELARTVETIAPLATGLSNVVTGQQLVSLLTQYGSGYTGGTSAAAIMAQLNLPTGPAFVGTGAGVNNPAFPYPVINDPEQLLSILGAHPEYLQMLTQAGVAQEKMVDLNKAFTDLVIEAVNRIAMIKQSITDLQTTIPEQLKELLPEDVFEAFKTNTLEPMVAVLQNILDTGGTMEDIRAAFAAGGFEKQMELLSSIIPLIQEVDAAIAQFGGDLSLMVKASISVAKGQLAASESAVQDAKSRLAEAISGPEIVEATHALEKAIIDRYNLEKTLIGQIEQNIGTILSTYGKPLMDLQISLAASGTGIGDLLSSLQTMAETSASTTVRLFAVNSAIGAISAQGGSMAQAEPFLAQLRTLTTQAVTIGDREGALKLLQQQAAALQSLGQGQVAAVQRWQQSAVAALSAIDRQQQQQAQAAQAASQARMAELQKRSQDEVAAIQEAGQARQDALNAERDAISESLATARQWASVAKSVGDYLVSLRLGSQAPPSPMAQFTMAQGAFSSAYSSFLANRTPEGAQEVQKSAGDLLAVAQLIYTRPSPEYAALFEDVTTKLDEVKAASDALAAPQAALAQRLDDLTTELTALSESVRDQVAAAQANMAAQIAAEQQGLAAQLAAIQGAADAARAAAGGTVDAINASAQAQIDAINGTIGGMLAEIANQQGELLKELIGAQEEIILGITGGQSAADYMAAKATETVDALNGIKSLLEAYLARSLAPPPPLQRGSAFVPRTAAFTLHAGEMVLPPAVADIVRASKGVEIGGGTIPVSISIGDIHVHGDGDPVKLRRDVLRDVEDGLRRGKLGQIVEERVR